MSSSRFAWTAVCGLVFIHPGIQFKSVKGDALFPYGDLGQIGPYFAVEPIAVHTQVCWYIPKAYQAREQDKVYDSACGHAQAPFVVIWLLNFWKLIDCLPESSLKNMQGVLRILGCHCLQFLGDPFQ